MRRIFAIFLSLGVFLLLPAKVFAATPDLGHSQYTSPSNVAPSDGTSTETVIVHLHDSGGSSVVGDTINLSSSNNSSAVFNNSQTTDSNGDATFTVTSTTSGTTNITLNDTTNAVTFTDWFTISFYDASKGCQNVPAAPVLSSVISNSNNNATLTWVDSADPVSNYLISYGIASKNYIYGDPNVGGQGTTTFTIGSLAGGTKYYFAVAANNNCGVGGFSNEVSAVVGPLPSTPVPVVVPTSQPAISAPAIITDTPTDIPQPTDTPASAPASQDVNSTFRNLGIGIIAAGILVIGTVFVIQKTKKRNTIRPFQ